MEQDKKPLENYRDIDAFKTYVSDVGLLCAKKEIVPEDILYPTHELDDFKGGMTENYVCTQLTASGYTSYYWTADRGGYEIDFLIQREGAILPIEVKAGEHTKAKSLEVYQKTFRPEQSLRLSTKNFGRENGLRSVPLYACFCI